MLYTRKLLQRWKRADQAPVLAYFDPCKGLIIQYDASGHGLGAALLQDGQPLAYGNRELSEAETRYATIEKEMFAIVFALEKWHQYTYARPDLSHRSEIPKWQRDVSSRHA